MCHRKTVRSPRLQALVQQELQQQIKAGRAFTAYDVTTGLRQQHPNLDIVHQKVRLQVHSQMSLVLAVGGYATQQRTFPKGPATCYVPVLNGQVITSGAGAVAALPAPPAPAITWAQGSTPAASLPANGTNQ